MFIEYQEKWIERERAMKLKFNQLLSKKSKHICLYPECNSPAILSHSISKSTLKHIAEDKHLIYQKFNRTQISIEEMNNPTDVNMQLIKIGINEASTFKGFCKQHDNNIFESLDNDGIITQRDIILQLYRTLSKKYFINIMASTAEFEIFNKEYYSNKNFEEIKAINLKNIIILLNDLLVDFPELATSFTITNKEVLWIKPFSDKISLDISILVKKIDIPLPIVVESSFTIRMNNNHHQDNAVIIFPTKDSIFIIILCHHDAVPIYSSHFQSPLKILNFIESIIMQDSEFYLNPNYFNSWDKSKIDIIKKDLYFLEERNFLEDYDLSFFDDIRKELLKNESKDIQIYEEGKIKNIPCRSSLKERFWKLTQVIEGQRHNKINANK